MDIKEITKIIKLDVIIPGAIGSLIAAAIISIITLIIRQLEPENKTLNEISFALLVLAVIVFIVAIFIIVKNRYKIIKFYESREKYPKKYQIKNALEFIAKHELDLIVIGRTNASWFKDISADSKNNKSNNLIELYKTALKKGCKLQFIMQHKFIENINASDKDKQQIQNDYEPVIESFKQLKNGIPHNNQNIKLFLTNESIENSMTKVYSENSDKNKKYGYFIFDLNMNIDTKPSIIFTKASVYSEYDNKFEQIRNAAMNLDIFEQKTQNAKNKIENLIRKYDESSSQRSNNNKKLVFHYYQKKKQLNYPPVSIQFLITNTCTSLCVMCNHHKISSTYELSTDEIKNILQCISYWGTKNVIISGGEPLNHKDCLEILKFGKELELNLGLLTNGIVRGNEPISAVDARKIKESCEWVQLSIDSFDKETYKKIRVNEYSIVEESLKNLKNEDVNVEICYTIQSLNIDEAIKIVKGETTPSTNGVPIRFKFAHGPNNNNFLVEETKIIQFRQTCSTHGSKYNGKYLNNMFRNGYFTPEDISKGKPLKTKNKQFHDKNYNCQIMNYSFKIDALGEIYPCCFLFDDNQGENSAIRSNFKLYELRKNGKVDAPTEEESKEILKNILGEIGTYKTDKIPINEEACSYCTRHFYQNEFLNELENIVKEYDDIKYIPEFSEDNSKLWI